MKKILKWSGIILAVLAGILLVALAAAYFQTQSRFTRAYQTPNDVVAIPTDAESIALGKRIFQYRGCEACHGEKLEGKVYLDNPAVGLVISGNLTKGAGGIGREMSDADWVRGIRYGIRPDKTPMLFMPSTEFYFMSDADLGAVIAYIKSMPAVDNTMPRSSVSLMGRVVMTLVPQITFIPAELIPMSTARPAAPEVGITPEYGEYLTGSCKVCHGLTMSGGAIPGFPSDWPPAPNITFGGGSALPTWSEADFINTIRTGKTPMKKELRSQYMPWGSYKYMSDDELKAVWVYLKSLPKLDYGNR
ncbi:MAG: c-type cytochrome [Anaerolineales bacterium]|nr:c-type cytochrome [Anaerolineales bacterium]